MTTSADEVVPPVTVQRSFWLWIALVAVEVVSGVIGLLNPQLGQQIAPDGGPVGLYLTIVIVFAVLVLALVVFAALKMRQGRNWARILLTVLGVLSLVDSLRASADAASIIIAIAQFVIIAAAIFFAFQRSANAYFASTAAR